jgi:putative tRNA adenosine deaminase-associated protein
VAYFTAVLARSGGGWVSRDVPLDEVADLTELAEQLRLVEDGEEPVLVLLEREDDWWAIVRVDGDEDPRIFMSDVDAASRSPYAAFLDPPADEAGWGGDLDLLADLGTSPDELRQICEDELPPMDATAVVAEAGGFAEALDSLR